VFGGFASSSSRGPIGIDLGASGVRLMQLQRRANGWAVHAAAFEAIPHVSAVTPADYQQHAAQALKLALDAGRFSGSTVVSSLPASSVQYKNMRLPSMPADELQAAVAWEASDRLHLGDGAQIQFFNAGEVRQGDDLREEIIVAAAPVAAVDRHVQMLTELGLKPVAIEDDASALARSAASESAGDIDAAAEVYLDVGYATSKVLIARNGRVLFFKVIDLGVRALIQAVADHMDCQVDAADEVRLDRIRDGDPASIESLQAAYATPMETLSREIGLCLRYYCVTFRGERPAEARITGGGSLDPALRTMLAGDLSIDLKPATPLKSIDHQAAGIANMTGDCSEWTAAVGLALRVPRSMAKRGAA